MTYFLAATKCLGLYLVFFLPLARLQQHKFDPHIGNSTASRVSGLPLTRIFLQHSFGMVFPMLSISLQYDFFRGNLKRYKLFHALLISLSGPLFYLFAYLFTGDERVAFVAALFYSVSFHFPIVGNWLIQPEHYEILFFLAGASLALAGLNGGWTPLLLAGTFVMGSSQLCKLPGLASIWITTHLLMQLLPAEKGTAALVAGSYLAPYLIFVAAEKSLSRTPHGAALSEPGKRRGFDFLIRSTISRYLSHYQKDPQTYLYNYVYYHLKRYLLQFLPLLFLTAVFFTAGATPLKEGMWLGLGIVSLIFVIRMGFAYVHSFNIVVSLAAGWALFALPSPGYLPVAAGTAVVLAAVAAWQLRAPLAGTFRRIPQETTNLEMLAQYLKEHLNEGECWFANINSSLSHLYTMSERGYPDYFTILAMGGYGPYIDSKAVSPAVAKEGIALVKTLTAAPPACVVQSCTDWPIANMKAIEKYCGLSYHVEAIINPFVIYRISERRRVEPRPGDFDLCFLFDANEGSKDNIEAAASFVDRIHQMEALAGLKAHSLKNPRQPEKKENEAMPEQPAQVMQPEPQQGGGDVILFLDTYYPAFLEKLYAANPSLAGESYDTQKAALIGARFGDSDYYSHGLMSAGYQADDLIVNAPQLQLAWCRENGFQGNDLRKVVLEQVKRLRPAVVYLQDVGLATADFVQALREHAGLVAAQHACPVPPQVDFSWFDVVFTAVPYLADDFRAAGTAAYYMPLAFDPRVNSSFSSYQRRFIDVSFVGGFSGAHAGSYPLLEHLARTTPILFWGYGTAELPGDSAIHARYQGEAWGQEMMKLFANSKITVNRHIDMAKNYACNMRLYETTGNGALLITDYKENLDQLFEIGKEVVAYRTPEECAALVQYYLAHPDEAEAIARAGQARTLRDHTYVKRMARTGAILERHLRYRREEGIYRVDGSVSCGHHPIAEAEVTPELTSAWRSAEIPARQRAIVQRSLADMYRGQDMPEYRILADVMRPAVYPRCPVLELGCSSGYVYEILEYFLKLELDFTGVDYSEAMIAMARDYYPRQKFFAADGASLFFADRQFHLVISSCVLLHVPNYRQHIFETARVADRFVVASRTPVCKRRPTQYLKKLAYGIETVELVFNEEELLREFAVNRFQLVRGVEYQADPESDNYLATYLFRRV